MVKKTCLYLLWKSQYVVAHLINKTTTVTWQIKGLLCYQHLLASFRVSGHVILINLGLQQSNCFFFFILYLKYQLTWLTLLLIFPEVFFKNLLCSRINIQFSLHKN